MKTGVATIHATMSTLVNSKHCQQWFQKRSPSRYCISVYYGNKCTLHSALTNRIVYAVPETHLYCQQLGQVMCAVGQTGFIF